MIDYLMLVGVGVLYVIGFAMMGMFSKSERTSLPERYKE